MIDSQLSQEQAVNPAAKRIAGQIAGHARNAIRNLDDGASLNAAVSEFIGGLDAVEAQLKAITGDRE